MIRLSRLADYAIVILCEMAASGADTLSSRQLHERTGISHAAIMKILKLLAGAGLVSSERGIHGGYCLTVSPSAVHVLHVVEAIDGPVAITLCSHGSEASCAFEANCRAKNGWHDVNQALQRTLAGFSIADFLNSYNQSTNQQPFMETQCIQPPILEEAKPSSYR